jgi:hypothetical protein
MSFYHSPSRRSADAYVLISHSWRLGVRCPTQSGLYALPPHESMPPQLSALRVSLSQTSSSPPKMSNRENPRECFRCLERRCRCGFSSGGSPDPYILGAEKCGVKPERCLVVEDAPNGIRSGNAAGCKTLGLLTTHSPEQVAKASPDYTVKNLSR